MTNLGVRKKQQLQLVSIASAPSTAPCSMPRGLQEVLFVLGNGIQTHICHLELFLVWLDLPLSPSHKKNNSHIILHPPLSVNHIIHDQLLFHYKLHKIWAFCFLNGMLHSTHPSHMYWRIKVLPQGFLGEFVGLGGKKALPVFLHKSLSCWGALPQGKHWHRLRGTWIKGQENLNLKSFSKKM